MKKIISSIILMFLVAGFQGCSSHSTNLDTFRAPGAATGKAVYPSEEWEEKNSRY